MPLGVHRAPPSTLCWARGERWTQSARRCKPCRVAKRRIKFQYPDCPLQEAMFLAEMRISLSWMTHGQTSILMSLQSLPGVVLGSPRWSTIGSDGWLLNIIVLRSSFLVGPSIDRAAVGALRPQMNFLTRLSLGLAIQIHGSELPGRRAKDWRSSSRIVE